MNQSDHKALMPILHSPSQSKQHHISHVKTLGKETLEIKLISWVPSTNAPVRKVIKEYTFQTYKIWHDTMFTTIPNLPVCKHC